MRSSRQHHGRRDEAETNRSGRVRLLQATARRPGIPYQRYVLVLGSGQERSGFLDKDRKAEVELDEDATIRFPGLVDVESA